MNALLNNFNSLYFVVVGFIVALVIITITSEKFAKKILVSLIASFTVITSILVLLTEVSGRQLAILVLLSSTIYYLQNLPKLRAKN
jgi:hypothetical protein